MNRTRTVLLITLILLPIAVFAVIGTWALWETGLLVWTGWLLPVCWLAAYLLARRAESPPVPIERLSTEPPVHWTARDRAAADIVTRFQQQIRDVDPPQLTDPHFYLTFATELSLEIARYYHPSTEDPLTSLTVPEILAAAHLAIGDLEAWVNDSVPGSHLLTVKQWRMLARAPEYAKVLRDVGWLLSAFGSPASLARYAGSRVAMAPLSRQLRTNMLGAFFAMFLGRVGFYAIELNSGRLRGGAARYRMAMRDLQQQPSAPHTGQAATADEHQHQPDVAAAVAIAVVGQVKAGKSSVINALLGEQRAATDVLPQTGHVEQYRLKHPESSVTLTLFDTAGYGDSGAGEDQLVAMRRVLFDSDLVLVVMNVTEPAREADRRLLHDLFAWYERRPEQKPPPAIGVLTHVDGLSPLMEWEPPYDWTRPERTKERSIHDAVNHVTGEFDGLLAACVPVCSEANRVWGVQESLLPVIVSLLGESRACTVLRTLHADLSQSRLSQLYRQFQQAGRLVLTNLEDILLGP